MVPPWSVFSDLDRFIVCGEAPIITEPQFLCILLMITETMGLVATNCERYWPRNSSLSKMGNWVSLAWDCRDIFEIRSRCELIIACLRYCQRVESCGTITGNLLDWRRKAAASPMGDGEWSFPDLQLQRCIRNWKEMWIDPCMSLLLSKGGEMWHNQVGFVGFTAKCACGSHSNGLFAISIPALALCFGPIRCIGSWRGWEQFWCVEMMRCWLAIIVQNRLARTAACQILSNLTYLSTLPTPNHVGSNSQSRLFVMFCLYSVTLISFIVVGMLFFIQTGTAMAAVCPIRCRLTKNK
jgi:hypothetical protein